MVSDSMTTCNTGARPAGGPRATSHLDAALAYLRAGLTVIPIKADGSKAPAVSTWKEYATALPSEAAVRSWWREGTAGIGVVGGAVSGNLECLDFDRGELFAPW